MSDDTPIFPTNTLKTLHILSVEECFGFGIKKYANSQILISDKDTRNSDVTKPLSKRISLIADE